MALIDPNIDPANNPTIIIGGKTYLFWDMAGKDIYAKEAVNTYSNVYPHTSKEADAYEEPTPTVIASLKAGDRIGNVYSYQLDDNQQVWVEFSSSPNYFVPADGNSFNQSELAQQGVVDEKTQFDAANEANKPWYQQLIDWAEMNVEIVIGIVVVVFVGIKIYQARGSK